MEDGNESLQTMGLNTNFRDVDGYMDIEVKDDKTPTIDGTDISTFTTETLPLVDEKKFGHPFQKSRLYPSRTIGVFSKIRNSVPRRARGEMSSPVRKDSSLDKWIVREHGKIERVLPH